MADEKTLAEEAAEDLEGYAELEEAGSEDAAEEVAEEVAADSEEEAGDEPAAEARSVDALYDAIDDLATKIWERFDQIAAAIIDAGAVVNDSVDTVYDRADDIEDELALEDLDYSL